MDHIEEDVEPTIDGCSCYEGERAGQADLVALSLLRSLTLLAWRDEDDQ